MAVLSVICSVDVEHAREDTKRISGVLVVSRNLNLLRNVSYCFPSTGSEWWGLNVGCQLLFSSICRKSVNPHSDPALNLA